MKLSARTKLTIPINRTGSRCIVVLLSRDADILSMLCGIQEDDGDVRALSHLRGPEVSMDDVIDGATRCVSLHMNRSEKFSRIKVLRSMKSAHRQFFKELDEARKEGEQ